MTSDLLFGEPDEPADEPWMNEPRKLRSERRLSAEGVPINRHLSRVENEDEVKLRSAADVARRCLVLYPLAGVGAGACDAGSVTGLLRTRGLWDQATPAEKAFLENATPGEQQKIDAGWRICALWALLWSLGHVEDLGLFRQGDFDLARIHEVMGPASESPKDFVNAARLRPTDELCDQLDLIYRTRWALVDRTAPEGEEPPAGLSPDIAAEVHHAMNWLCGYAGAEWDDVTCDT